MLCGSGVSVKKKKEQADGLLPKRVNSKLLFGSSELGKLDCDETSKIPFTLWSRSRVSYVAVLASPHIGPKLTLALHILRILLTGRGGERINSEINSVDAQELTTRDIEKLSEKGKSVNTEKIQRV